jgi:hypothetical protein
MCLIHTTCQSYLLLYLIFKILNVIFLKVCIDFFVIYDEANWPKYCWIDNEEI